MMDIQFNFQDEIIKGQYATKDFQSKLLGQFNQVINSADIGFFKTTADKNHVEQCQDLYKKFKSIKNFIHIGIGGSSLGPEMLLSALPSSKDRDNGGPIHFEFINNIDPDKIAGQLMQVDPKESLFYFVSKSGSTAETLATFAVVCNFLSEHDIQASEYQKYMVFATDPDQSQLREIANELSISTLPIPTNVGGRFSVLTPVGLFPALFCGIDIEQLLSGANEIKNKLLDEDVSKNPLVQCACQVLSLKEEGVSQTVLMPYSSLLRDFSFWFVQLWAESLGKKHNKDGKEVFDGLTPIPAYGATDQHSQMQLFMEGPYDKLLFVVELEHFAHDFSLSNSFAAPALQKLSPHTMGKLFKAELHGAIRALKEAKRPLVHFNIQQLDEEHLGALILFFESLTTIVGLAFNINPFDQPGVELGKKYAYEILQQ